MTIRPRRSLLNPALQRPSALKATPRDPKTLWLDKNENLDPELMALTKSLLSTLPSPTLATYPEAGDLYRTLGAWAGVSPESLLLTPGSDGAIRLVFEAFVEHGEPVVHTMPTFAMYPVYSQMFGATVREVHYQPSDEGPRLDSGALIGAVRDLKPKLVCLPNPDSPTGTVVPSATLRELLAACEAAGAVLLIDEAYHPFYDDSVARWTEQSRNLVVARTFAKAWGVAGLRIGYAVAHPETVALLHKMRPMYEVSTLSIEFMLRMFEHRDAMEAAVRRLAEGKAYFVDALRRLGFRVLPTSGNFVHVAFGVRGAAIQAVMKNQVLYRAVTDHPSLAGYSRFSLGPKSIMTRVVDLIHSAVGVPA